LKFGSFRALSKKKSINLVHKKGVAKAEDEFYVKYLDSQDHNEAAFLIRKKIGNAIVRNTIKRRVRHILSKQNPDLKMHVLFFAKPEILNLSFAELKTKVEKILKKCAKK
jgi:ribonuclease P protein component